MPKHIVVISGSGHSWVAFDYRNTREDPPVIFIDADQKQIIELAPNFDAFLQGLYLEEVETEDDHPEHPARNWTMEEMTTALASNDELEVCHALDYLYANPTGHAAFIEQQLVTLLQHANLEMKQIAANYAYHFHEKGVLFLLAIIPPSFLSKQDSPHMHIYEPCEKVIAFHHFMSYNLT